MVHSFVQLSLEERRVIARMHSEEKHSSRDCPYAAAGPLQWLGTDFDPNAPIDTDAIDIDLLALAKRWVRRPRKKV